MNERRICNYRISRGRNVVENGRSTYLFTFSCAHQEKDFLFIKILANGVSLSEFVVEAPLKQFRMEYYEKFQFTDRQPIGKLQDVARQSNVSDK
nr:unnamed protein product [Callosobruchus chinensis]